MDFQLTKEQAAIQKMVREFAVNEVEPIAAEIDKEHRFPAENVAKMQKLGLMSIPFPRQYGGAGGDELSYVLTVEELARVCASTSVVVSAHSSLGCWPIYAYGTEEQKQKYLVPLLKGEKLGAFGLTEPGAGTDAAGQKTVAVLEGDHYVINGSKCFITNGGYADTFIVMAMTDRSKGTKGISAFIVDRKSPGFSIGKTEDKLGIHASSTTELIFENMIVPKENLLGKEGQGFKIAMSTLDGGRIGIAAQALGIAQGALDKTIEYMKQRKQFGKPLAAFQALQFEVAEMATRIQAARMLVYRAADCEDKGLPYGQAAAMAKYFAAETAMYVTTKAIQLHGGYGYTADYPVERMFRDAKITEIYEGTTEVQKMVISGALLR